MRTAAVPTRFFHRDRVILFAVLLGVALALVFTFAAQLVFTVSASWSHALRVSFAHWLVPFGVLAVGAALTYAAPLERRRLFWTVPLHLVVCAIIVTVSGPLEERRLEAMRAPVRAAIHGPLPEMPPPPPAVAPDDGPPSLEGPPRGRGLRSFRMQQPHRPFFAVLASSRWQLHLAVYWVSVSLASAWRLRQRAEDRERKTLELAAGLSQAKLDALRLQLQPHFLFNTLNAIATLVHKDASAADDMITNLSDLLRLSLETTAAEVPLRRELELLDRFLAIERVRLGERLRVEQTIEPGVLDAAVPPLMVQTLVENAIRHGLEPRRAPGTITIRAAREHDLLRLTIADDGVGLAGADIATERRGLGLANTEARLRELYGSAGRVTLHAPDSGGVRVELELPWHPAPAAAS